MLFVVGALGSTATAQFTASSLSRSGNAQVSVSNPNTQNGPQSSFSSNSVGLLNPPFQSSSITVGSNSASISYSYSSSASIAPSALYLAVNVANGSYNVTPDAPYQSSSVSQGTGEYISFQANTSFAWSITANLTPYSQSGASASITLYNSSNQVIASIIEGMSVTNGGTLPPGTYYLQSSSQIALNGGAAGRSGSFSRSYSFSARVDGAQRLAQVSITPASGSQPAIFSATMNDAWPNGTARLQASLDLGLTDPWTDISTKTINATGSVDFTNIVDSRPQALGATMDFFRVVAEPAGLP